MRTPVPGLVMLCTKRKTNSLHNRKKVNLNLISEPFKKLTNTNYELTDDYFLMNEVPKILITINNYNLCKKIESKHSKTNLLRVEKDAKHKLQSPDGWTGG